MKFIVTLSLFAIIFWQSEYEDFLSVVTQSDPHMILWVFVGMILCVVISAYKWKIILSIHGISQPFRKLNSIFFTALFFNNFLPSNIGGDAYRMYSISTAQNNVSGAVASVIVDRIIGFWALIVLSFLGAVWQYYKHGPAPEWIVPVLILLGAGSLSPLLLLTRMKSLFNKIINRVSVLKKLAIISELYRDYRNNRLKTFYVVLISFGFHVFTLCWMFLLSHAVGESIGINKIVIGLTLSNLAALIPVSLNGLGLLDGSYIFIMVELGMPFNEALMMMMIIRVLLVVLSLFGGVFYLFNRKERNVNEIKKKMIPVI